MSIIPLFYFVLLLRYLVNGIKIPRTFLVIRLSSHLGLTRMDFLWMPPNLTGDFFPGVNTILSLRFFTKKWIQKMHMYFRLWQRQKVGLRRCSVFLWKSQSEQLNSAAGNARIKEEVIHVRSLITESQRALSSIIKAVSQLQEQVNNNSIINTVK